MEQKAKHLREQVEQLEKKFAAAKKDLTNYVNSCQHKFSDTVYDPIHTPAYTIPGDPPGTMGVDRQLPTYVPAKTEKRWRRECGICGEIQYTTRTSKTYHETPDFKEMLI